MSAVHDSSLVWGDSSAGRANETGGLAKGGRAPHDRHKRGTRGSPSRRITAVVVAAFIAAMLGGVGARQADTRSVAVDADDIGGVVTGPRGPEAGAFVIAETTNLPTRLIKSVVTDDQGRYLIPDLPQATYDVWVRGYGLVDSQKVKTTPGKTLALTAVAAPSPRVAAEYCPAAYWPS